MHTLSEYFFGFGYINIFFEFADVSFKENGSWPDLTAGSVVGRGRPPGSALCALISPDTPVGNHRSTKRQVLYFIFGVDI